MRRGDREVLFSVDPLAAEAYISLFVSGQEVTELGRLRRIQTLRHYAGGDAGKIAQRATALAPYARCRRAFSQVKHNAGSGVPSKQMAAGSNPAGRTTSVNWSARASIWS